jgi:hypothetical protein
MAAVPIGAVGVFGQIGSDYWFNMFPGENLLISIALIILAAALTRRWARR